jgi:uncharacterized repeat protein (TIGR01451 family)
VPVYHAIRVSAVKSSNKPHGSAVYAGEPLRYDIVVKNTGDQILSDVSLIDTVTNCFDPITNTATTTKGTISYEPTYIGSPFYYVIANFNNLGIGDEATVSFEAKPKLNCSTASNQAAVFIGWQTYFGNRIGLTNIVTHVVRPQSVVTVTIEGESGLPLTNWLVEAINLSNNEKSYGYTSLSYLEYQQAKAVFFLSSGSYKICETLQSGWTNVYPGDTCYWMTLNLGDNVSLTFRNAPTTPTSTPIPPTATPEPTNAALKINVQTTDYAPLSGWTVTAENTSSGETTSQTTDANGVASFSLPAGSYKICEALQSGWTNVYPGDTCYWITLNIGDEVSLSFRNAQTTATSTPLPPTATPAPTNAALKINVQTTDYAPLSGWSVTTENTSSGETTSQTTDPNGVASFSLPAGSYKICEALQSGWTNVYPGDTCYWITLNIGDEVSLSFRNAQTTATSTPLPPTATPAPTNAALKINVQMTDYAPLSGWSVTTQNLSNGDTSSQTTDASGVALFSLPAGSYKICETLQTGWTNVYPGDTCYWITLVASDDLSLYFRNAQ